MNIKDYPFAQDLITDNQGQIQQVIINFEDYQQIIETYEDTGLYRAMIDVKDEKSTSSYSVIKNLVFTDILAVKQLSEINNLKKLKGEYNAYRIRIGDYRIGFFVEEDTITFARVLHRREFYRYFP